MKKKKNVYIYIPDTGTVQKYSATWYFSVCHQKNLHCTGHSARTIQGPVVYPRSDDGGSVTVSRQPSLSPYLSRERCTCGNKYSTCGKRLGGRRSFAALARSARAYVCAGLNSNRGRSTHTDRSRYACFVFDMFAGGGRMGMRGRERRLVGAGQCFLGLRSADKLGRWGWRKLVVERIRRAGKGVRVEGGQPVSLNA